MSVGSAEESVSRFDRAIAAIDAANEADPNQVEWAGARYPKERLHAERASHWLSTLAPEADELLRLAVRAHHLQRWQLPRGDYPAGRAGYHAWRTELQRRHAAGAAEILERCGYSPEEIDRVSALIRKRGLGRDPDARHFEDSLCLVFVETQLEAFAAGHSEEKVVSILARTLPKMSEGARSLAAGLCQSEAPRRLLERAVEQLQARAQGT
jgi:hypothetical protein